MPDTSTFRVNEPHVISEAIDGEVVILNFDKGTYYSLNESAMAVWQGIQGGLGRGGLLRALTSHYADAGAVAEADLARLLKSLEEEQLIVACDGPAADAPATPNGALAPYVAPQLEKFTDLQDLLLLDPIHDVDESGWPSNN